VSHVNAIVVLAKKKYRRRETLTANANIKSLSTQPAQASLSCSQQNTVAHTAPLNRISFSDQIRSVDNGLERHAETVNSRFVISVFVVVSLFSFHTTGSVCLFLGGRIV
jgi:hypothetical protein